jgi:hypothetical protein
MNSRHFHHRHLPRRLRHHHQLPFWQLHFRGLEGNWQELHSFTNPGNGNTIPGYFGSIDGLKASSACSVAYDRSISSIRFECA